jgi:hypothetical protein
VQYCRHPNSGRQHHFMFCTSDTTVFSHPELLITYFVRWAYIWRSGWWHDCHNTYRNVVDFNFEIISNYWKLNLKGLNVGMQHMELIFSGFQIPLWLISKVKGMKYLSILWIPLIWKWEENCFHNCVVELYQIYTGNIRFPTSLCWDDKCLISISRKSLTNQPSKQWSMHV